MNEKSSKKKMMSFKELEAWQKKRLFIVFGTVMLISILFLGYASYSLISDKLNDDKQWYTMNDSDDDIKDTIDELSADATEVTVGTYIEEVKQVSLKDNTFRVVALVWFKWLDDDTIDMLNHFRIYNGEISDIEVIKDYNENGEHYQLARVDAKVSKNFVNNRFPLETHLLRFYIESEYLINQVVFVDDIENDGINKHIDISGYNIVRYKTDIFNYQYDSNHNDPETEAMKTADGTGLYSTEHMTAIEINRDSWGLYVKCFIALFGTTGWVLITLFINTYHRVDPLGMLPSALFGTVSNIMIGANLLPDALGLGLLEYVNFWGIFIILVGSVTVINVNRIRNHYDNKEYAGYFGRWMFITTCLLVAVGNILLPLSAYKMSF